MVIFLVLVPFSGLCPIDYKLLESCILVDLAILSIRKLRR